MKIELESLIQKFEACRSKAKGKKVVYPLRLRKAVASLVDHSPKVLATELGVSQASIKAWSKNFAPKISENDMLPILISKDVEPSASSSEGIKVKIIAIEVSVPSAKLEGTLADIIQGMGASPC